MRCAQKLRALVSRVLSRRASPGRKEEERKEVLAFAPYPRSIYGDLLQALASDKRYTVCHLENVMERKRRDKVTVLIRHDIDTLDCMRKMPLLLDEDLRFGFIPSVYLRVDGEAYSLGEWREVIDTYRRRGIPFGLHSVCYIHQDFLEVFRQETRAFTSQVGGIPRSFTLHGLGDRCLRNRLQFILQVKTIARENGYAITDCSEEYLSYDYVIHDSHWNESKQRRYLRRDIEQVSFFKKGNIYLVLTHPCYWENEA